MRTVYSLAGAIRARLATRIAGRLFPATQRCRITSCLIIPRAGDRVPLFDMQPNGLAVVDLDRYAIVPRELVDERALKDRADAAYYKHRKRERRKEPPRPSLATLRRRAKLWRPE